MHSIIYHLLFDLDRTAWLYCIEIMICCHVCYYGWYDIFYVSIECYNACDMLMLVI